MSENQSTPTLTDLQSELFWRMVENAPFIVPVEVAEYVQCARCKMYILRVYRTCPACGQALTKGNG